MQVCLYKELELKNNTAETIKLCNGELGDKVVSNVYLEVKADTSEGATTFSTLSLKSEGNSIGAIRLSDYTALAALNAGLFIVDTAGIKSLTFTSTGDCLVKVKGVA